LAKGERIQMQMSGPPGSGRATNVNGQYAAALERCEAAARRHDHVLGVWQKVDERLHASLCKACGAMVLVARPAHQERWRAGGRALKQSCLQKRDSVRRHLIFGISP
jgi:DNA-binding GntR family transcriptional regulator